MGDSGLKKKKRYTLSAESSKHDLYYSDPTYGDPHENKSNREMYS